MKLLVVTQAVDRKHPLLGFFVAWLEALRDHEKVESLEVICLADHAENIEGTKITCIGGGSRISRLIKFRIAIAKSPCDTVLVHMTPIWLVLGWPDWALRRVRTSLWYTHGSVSTALRIAVRLAHTTLTATPSAFPIKSPRVHAIGHAIDDAFARQPRSPRPTDRFSMLAVGRIMSRKRVRETIAFVSKIIEREPNATFQWIGPHTNADYDKEIEQDMDFFNLEERPGVFPGESLHADLPSIYANHDLLLHLSATDSLDKVVIEALASGCPVFSTNPATIEGVGKRWGWKGALDGKAVTDALERLSAGVAPEERQRVANAFALKSFIDRLITHIDAT